MNEIVQARSVEGVQYMAFQWNVDAARDRIRHELQGVAAAWQALEEQAQDPGADQAAIAAEAVRLIADTLTAQRSVTEWFARGTPQPAWTVEGGHVVLGAVRVPLSTDLIETWMEGEAA